MLLLLLLCCCRWPQHNNRVCLVHRLLLLSTLGPSPLPAAADLHAAIAAARPQLQFLNRCLAL
jgi:hypothetical protein